MFNLTLGAKGSYWSTSAVANIRTIVYKMDFVREFLIGALVSATGNPTTLHTGHVMHTFKTIGLLRRAITQPLKVSPLRPIHIMLGSPTSNIRKGPLEASKLGRTPQHFRGNSIGPRNKGTSMDAVT
jgi:hypothetical protein